MSEFSQRLKEIMSIRNVKQSDIVTATKITKSVLCEYLAGKYVPKQVNMRKLAKFFNVSYSWLEGEDVPMELPLRSWENDFNKNGALANGVEQIELLNIFSKLNKNGKKEAIKRLNELAKLEDYTI